MKRKIVFCFAAFFCSFLIFAEGENLKIRVGLLNGPTCIPSAYLMENTKSVSKDDFSAELEFQKFADPQALLPKLIKKEIDIGFMPLNVAAKVYNSGNKSLVCVAVTGLGNLSLITNDSQIQRFSDLKGKTVYVAGQGATPEYLLKYLLQENKISYGEKGDVKLDFSIPTAQLASQLISGKIQYAVMPEPFVTIAKLKSENQFYILDLQKEYLELSGAKNIYPLSVMVVRADFAKQNPQLLEVFLSEFEKSVAWTVENPVLAGELSQKFELGLSALVVEKSIPLSNYVFIFAKDAESEIKDLLSIFMKGDKNSIGGKLPDSGFYYDKKKS
ncbi:MAG: ABC transporter substrate-binding protein [Treponema sp.]|nr:ABC transporter substrate-binding protein [Treponema sp.]